MTNLEIETMLKEMDSLKAEKKKLETLIGQKEDALKKEIERRGLDELVTESGAKVRYVSFASERLDSSALKKALPDIFDQFKKVLVSKRFSYVA